MTASPTWDLGARLCPVTPDWGRLIALLPPKTAPAEAPEGVSLPSDASVMRRIHTTVADGFDRSASIAKRLQLPPAEVSWRLALMRRAGLLTCTSMGRGARWAVTAMNLRETFTPSHDVSPGDAPPQFVTFPYNHDDDRGALLNPDARARAHVCDPEGPCGTD